jgi:hypothetical protein
MEIYAFFDSSMFNLTLFLRNVIFIYTQTVTENNTESQLKTPEISNIWHNQKGGTVFGLFYRRKYSSYDSVSSGDYQLLFSLCAATHPALHRVSVGRDGSPRGGRADLL